MNRVRPELLRGFGVLSLFLAVTVATSLLLPYPIPLSEYVFVDLERVRENPELFNNRNISSTVTINSVSYMEPETFVFTREDVTLQIQFGAFESHDFEQGNRIFIRGTFQANQTVIVHEFYKLDYSSSIIRSIPGTIIFIVMFFSVYTIDFKQLAVVPRRVRDA